MAALGFAALFGSASLAEAQDRSLKLYFVHTGERATITYKRNGRFDPAGLAKINRLLRDWRRNENARMDPRLLDIVWQLYDRTNARDFIHVVSAYRSPATNAMLRGRSRTTGVAKKSQHMLGKAMDFYIPGVKLSTLRGLAMQMQAGGVGYYPTSGSPFVHVDVGSVRAWPRMARQELAKLFPNGRTLHLPPDGKPLPGYDVALADYKRRVGPQSIQLASSIGQADSGSDDDEGAVPMPASPSKARGSLLTAMLPVPKTGPLPPSPRRWQRRTLPWMTRLMMAQSSATAATRRNGRARRPLPISLLLPCLPLRCGRSRQFPARRPAIKRRIRS